MPESTFVWLIEVSVVVVGLAAMAVIAAGSVLVLVLWWQGHRRASASDHQDPAA